MKTLLALFALSASLVAAQAETVDVSNFYVDKAEDPITLRLRVLSVSFVLNGYGATDLRCEASPPPTFPSDILRCNDSETRYRFVVTEGAEGSGLQFGVRLYYDDRSAE